MPFIPSIELMSYNDWEQICVEHAGQYSHIGIILQLVLLEENPLKERIRQLKDLIDSLQEQDQAEHAIAKLLQQATVLYEALTYYKKQFNNDKPALLEMSKKYLNEKGVTYLTDFEREKYRVIPYEKHFYQLKSVNGRLSLVVYDSDFDVNVSRSHCQAEKKIFIETPEHDIFVGSPIQFKHSSFNRGKPVRMAGEIQIKSGQITMITSKSSHYRPPKTNFLMALLQFVKQNLFAKEPYIYDVETQDNVTLKEVTGGQPKEVRKKTGWFQFFSGADDIGDDILVKTAEEERESKLITRCQLGVGYLR